MSLIRIPQRFYDDHFERDLPAPEIVKATAKHYWISAEPSDELSELLDDANHYATGFDCEFGSNLAGICASARATARAIRKAIG